MTMHEFANARMADYQRLAEAMQLEREARASVRETRREDSARKHRPQHKPVPGPATN